MKRISKDNLYAVILAGGSGTRFWPLSRASSPKQFLHIIGHKSLLYHTALRLKDKFDASHIYIVTNQLFKNKVKQELRSFKIPVSNILLEPSGKNTAPAVCWAASVIHGRNPDAIMCVFPADHYICHKQKFMHILDKAAVLANQNYLVTFGIAPNRPDTGYGYLKIKRAKGVFGVEKFIEKPPLLLAQKFLKTKKYLWNSGMFIWRTDVILGEFKKYLPKIYKPFMKGKGRGPVGRFWRDFPSISIDYGVLEKAKNVVAV